MNQFYRNVNILEDKIRAINDEILSVKQRIKQLDSWGNLPVNQVLLGDCLELMKTLPDNCVDCVVTDPPYSLGKVKSVSGLLQAWLNGEDGTELHSKGFCGADWDVLPSPNVWQEVLRVLKPGGYALVFAGTRTYDLIGMSLRLAGFELQENLSWLFGSGFPKSKTNLKPAHELILVCYKPGKRTFNIEDCRLPTSNRYPSNVILSHNPDCVCNGTKQIKTESGSTTINSQRQKVNTYGKFTPSPFLGHHSADGTETIQAYQCSEGFEGEIFNYSFLSSFGKHVEISPLDKASFLLDQLPSLLEVSRNYHTTDTSLFRCAFDIYHTERNLQTDSLFDEVLNALHLSSLPGFRFDCQTYRDFCDELLRFVLISFQDGIPSLLDALSLVYHLLSSLSRNQDYLCSAQQIEDDFYLNNVNLDKLDCKSALSQFLSSFVSLPEQVCHKSDKVLQGRWQNEICASNHLNKILLTYIDENCLHNADISVCVKLLSLLHIDLAWRFILPSHIIQRSNHYIVLPKCPIRLLDEQTATMRASKPSGNSTRGQSNNGDVYGNRFNFKEIGQTINYQDGKNTANASRFFLNLPPETPFIYQPKASRNDRTINGKVENTHICVKPSNLMGYLAKLVCPPEGIVLDPFMGSGSTALGCLKEQRHYIGMEQSGEYYQIALERIQAYQTQTKD